MEFGKKTKRARKSHISIDSNAFVKNHPIRLMMYKNPPVEEITLEEFERFAVDRLKCKFGTNWFILKTIQCLKIDFV